MKAKRRTSIKAGEDWHIQLSARAFAPLRTDPAFQQLLGFARSMNGLRYVQETMLKGDKSKPGGARNRINSFLFMNSLLFEGYKYVQRMRQRFRGYKSWPSGFGALLANPTFRRLFSESMKRARDGVVFHIGENDLAKALERHTPATIVFLTGEGPSGGNTYYDLPDLLALHIFLGPSKDDDELLAKAETAFGEARDFAVAFIEAGDALISEGLLKLRFQFTRGLAPGTKAGGKA